MNGPGESVLLGVTHQTRYVYSERVTQAHHVACLQPLALVYQKLLSHVLEITPEPSQRSVSNDGFGNVREYFSHAVPHDELVVRAHSRVAVSSRFDALDLASSPPWEDVAAWLHYRAAAPYMKEAEFSYASPYIAMHVELTEYAALSFTPGRPLLVATDDLMRRINADFVYDPETTEISTPLLEAFKLRRGVCQDFSHVMIGAMRALGLAVRYVSGYLLTEPPPGCSRLVGVDASHAWVSVWCPLSGWVDFDPTNGVIPGVAHVTLALGRDYGDVAPLRGVIRGVGTHQLEVGVTVVPIEALR